MGFMQPAPSERPVFDRVLLVEDNPVIAMNTEALLQELGIDRVMVAQNLPKALDLIGAHRFDLAILDLDLDGESSLPAAEQLLQAKVPIIFSTGYGELSGLPEHYADVPLLKKPYTFVELKRLLLHS